MFADVVYAFDTGCNLINYMVVILPLGFSSNHSYACKR